MNILINLGKMQVLPLAKSDILIRLGRIHYMRLSYGNYELLADAVPEAIYNELPPRLQREVQVDHSRAPSLITP